MTSEQIDRLLREGEFPDPDERPELVETHISWVFLCDKFVYKIKKPLSYSFLDFSSLEKRKYYCGREIELNRRLTEDIYLDVEEIREDLGRFAIGRTEGEIVDYAIKMHKLDRTKQMDFLLQNNLVTEEDIHRLAEKIAGFHQETTVIYNKDFLDVKEKFNDLASEKDFLQNYLSAENLNIINDAMDMNNEFIEMHKGLFARRLQTGFFRDCHGDLHSRNIFLLPAPQPFDCIEFNDDFRQIDVLNEVAFLCMDLDAFGREDLSGLFLKVYNNLFPSMKTGEEYKLFVYYKSYRSNVRAKVNSLRARSAATDAERKPILREVEKYFQLMRRYAEEVES